MLEENRTRVEQRDDRMREHLIHLDHRSDQPVKAAVLDCSWQANSEDLQQAAHLVGQIHRLFEQCLSCAEQRTQPMRFTALHKHRAEPASAQYLSNALGVSFVRFVPHGRQRRAHLPGFHADDVETLVLQTEEKMSAERARFKADPLDWMGECLQAICDVINFARQLSLQTSFATAIDHAKRA